MGLESGPSSLERLEEHLEEFSEGLEGAVELVKEFEAETPLQNLPYYEELEHEGEAMLQAVIKQFGINPHTAQPIKQYSIEGTPDTPGEGIIEVMVFATNDPEVFLGRYTHADGQIDMTVRPLDVEE